MQGMHYIATMHIGGTISTAAARKFVLPFNASLVEVQIAPATNTDSVLDLGTPTAGEAYLKDKALPASGAIARFGAADLPNGKPLHLPAGSTIVAFVDEGGTAAANITIWLVFTEG